MSYVLLFILPTSVLAQQIKPGGLGSMAGQVVEGPMSILLNFMDDACYVAGIILLVVGFSKYLRHRENPQEVPLSTPIVYIILAVAVILLPLIYYLVQMAG
jgi:hypothetical protein